MFSDKSPIHKNQCVKLPNSKNQQFPTKYYPEKIKITLPVIVRWIVKLSDDESAIRKCYLIAKWFVLYLPENKTK